jgi:nucleoside diphosphate kinase
MTVICLSTLESLSARFSLPAVDAGLTSTSLSSSREMSDKTPPHARSPEAIDKDFADLMASKMPSDAARDKFERLWDETNAIAAQTVHTLEGQRYISLLKHMHETFEGHYAANGTINGHGKKRS